MLVYVTKQVDLLLFNHYMNVMLTQLHSMAIVINSRQENDTICNNVINSQFDKCTFSTQCSNERKYKCMQLNYFNKKINNIITKYDILNLLWC